MSSLRTRVPAIDGWFTAPTDGSNPQLIGARCGGCGTYLFPPRGGSCPNPHCSSDDLQPAEMSSRGTVWSYTTNCYAPPAPFVAPEPFEPYALVAVEMEAEGIIVLGQAADGVGVEDLKVGMPMQLDLGVLYRDDDHEYLMYTWAPAAPVAGEGV